ncbi:MAG: DUF4079 domain-containing protein, partial [Kovacikia sp.]
MVVRLAWQTRQRRLQVAAENKSRIPPIVGQEHVQIGRWLGGSVVGIALLGMAPDIFSKLVKNNIWTENPFLFIFVLAIYIATIGSLAILYNAKQRVWRAVFATLTGMGVIILGFVPFDSQPYVFQRNDEWYVSHFYYGMIATMLMIFSLAIIQEIYQDRQNRWRTVHIVLNSIALLFFIGQGITGTRDLLEIPLGWQEPYVYQCDFANKTCPEPAPK